MLHLNDQIREHNANHPEAKVDRTAFKVGLLTALGLLSLSLTFLIG